MPMTMLRVALTLLILAGCAGPSSPSASRGSSMPGNDHTQQLTTPIKVVTTFSTLNSFVEGAGGTYVSVTNLVPVGASPETYQPTPQDIAAVANAQLLFENGAGIEVWLHRTIQNAANSKLHIVVLSDGLPKIDHNPHLWMDPLLARAYTEKIRDALIALDPARTQAYRRNTAAYVAKLAALQRTIAAKLAAVPQQQRTMIVFHNAWQYFNNRFGIKTVGVIELSPGQEPNPSYIAHLVDLARTNHVRAVFSEPEYSPKLAQALAKSAGIRIVTDLYDDSIGTGHDPRVHDYISMLTYDTGTIVNALK